MEKVSQILSEIQKSWHTWFGLALAESSVFVLATFLKQFAEVSSLHNLIICVIVALTIVCIWFVTNTLPKTRKNKIGFVVSISCDDEQSHKLIRDDFIVTLRKLIASSPTGKYFQFIEIPSHEACKIIDSDDAQKLRVRTRSHFILYGRSRTRKIDSKDQHYIELDGLVIHNPIPTNVQQQLALEFSELLPRKLSVDKEAGLFAFELTSEWVELVAKYIMGIAAEVSGDLIHAELLFNEVQTKLVTARKDFHIYIKLKERLPIRLAEIREARSDCYLNQWFISHDEEYIDKLYIEISKPDQRAVSVRTLNFKAIYVFIKTRDVDESIKLIKSCPKNTRDAVWHLNLAFLEAYKGSLKTALRHYRNSDKLKIELLTLSQIENFMEYILSIEPDKAQIYYCLGYINWKIKGDNLQAIKDYRHFIEMANPSQYEEQIFYAIKWVEELETEQLRVVNER